MDENSREDLKIMKVYVVFDYPNIDPNSDKADSILEELQIDLDHFAQETGNSWYIDDALED
jgi:hypothetical protein